MSNLSTRIDLWRRKLGVIDWNRLSSLNSFGSPWEFAAYHLLDWSQSRGMPHWTIQIQWSVSHLPLHLLTPFRPPLYTQSRTLFPHTNLLMGALKSSRALLRTCMAPIPESIFRLCPRATFSKRTWSFDFSPVGSAFRRKTLCRSTPLRLKLFLHVRRIYQLWSKRWCRLLSLLVCRTCRLCQTISPAQH